jgi:hypothetical protein
MTPLKTNRRVVHDLRFEAGALEALQEGLSSWLGRAVRICYVSSSPLPMRSTYPIERVQVYLDSGEQMPIIFKRLRPEPGRGSPREVLIYRGLLAGQRFGAPELYASAHCTEQGRYWLFLEDVGDESLERCARPAWIAAVRWLAEMHGTYLGRESELRRLDWLADSGPETYLLCFHAARRNLEQAGAVAALPGFEKLTAIVPAVAEYLARQPRTLVHGDVFPHNIMVQSGRRIRPIDWESASLGLAALDVARLLDGWGPAEPALLDCYLSECARHARQSLNAKAFRKAFRLCGVLVALLHFAWSVDACANPRFVDQHLNYLGTLLAQLDAEGIHV